MRRYVWKPEWCWPYESAWSIMEKFKYANAVTNDVFKDLIGLRSSTSNWIMSEDLCIYRRSKFNIDQFYSIFNISHNHFSYIDIFCGNNFSRLLNNELYYCPKCMLLGYHSYLHQLKSLDVCPFHNEALVCAEYEGTKIHYSIDTTQVEAYSTMPDRATMPAEKFVNILPARKLIDGIWDVVPDNIRLEKSCCSDIRFFNPSTRISERFNRIQDTTMNMVGNLLFNGDDICKPVFSISLKECNMKYNELLGKAELWYKSLYQIFKEEFLQSWYIAMLIDDLIKEIDSEVLKCSTFNMTNNKFNYNLEDREFVKAASALLTAFIITNARTLHESIDNSIVFQYSIHQNSRCRFSIYNILDYKDFKNGFSKFIPYLIYKRLVDKLYTHIYDKLKKDPSLALNYYSPIDMEIPDYIITIKNEEYNIYEI